MKTPERPRRFPLSRLIVLLVGFSRVHPALADAPGAPPGPIAAPAQATPVASGSTFLGQHPQLNDLLFTEPTSPFLIGFGFSPLGLLPNRIAFTASVFQMHWVHGAWDWELLNASLGLAPGSDVHASQQFSVRAAPKYRLFSHLSVGPLFGYEYVAFPDVEAQVARGTLGTSPEPFSAGGLIYGAELAETFDWKAGRWFRVSEVAYEQTYAITPASAQAWGTRFASSALNADPSPLQAGLVFQLEFSILF